jgi:RHS repeat-associated protein
VTQSVSYTLDAGDRLTSRVAAGTGTGSENSTTTYGYSGGGSSADLQLGASNVLAERYLSLPGGVLLTRRYTTSGGDVWSIPDLHGDIIATTGPTGTITGSGELYDPFGNPIDPTTGATNVAATPTTRTNGLTDAWEGKNQVGYEHTAGLNDTLLGARLYLPTWGQFTSPDPVFGGNPNPYMYPDDPINDADLDGQASCGRKGQGPRKVCATGKIVGLPGVKKYTVYNGRSGWFNSYGYLHMKKHFNDIREAPGWDNFKWAIGQILRKPASHTYQEGNDTYKYTGPIEAINRGDGRVVNYLFTVIVNSQGSVITAYASSH